MECDNEAVRKKSRIWNPALDDCYELHTNRPGSPIPISVRNCTVFQNYTRFMQPCATVAQSDCSKIIQHGNTAMCFAPNVLPLSNYLMNTMMNMNFVTTNVPNLNCCAVCGSIFRLTSDLVQHMRINHRSSHYSRTRKRVSQ